MATRYLSGYACVFPVRLLLLLVGLCVLPGFSSGGEGKATEYQVKAAFLGHFIKFTEWPKDAFDGKKDPVVLAVLGKNPFGKFLDKAMKEMKIGKRKVEVRYHESLEGVGDPHVLFVPRTESDVVDDMRKALKGKSILIVGELKDFAVSGGVANFFLDKSKLRFEINPAEAKRRKLKISSKLLRLSKIIKESK